MTLFEVITEVGERFPSADGEEICDMVNELEDKIIGEIFSPCGIDRPRPSLNAKTDINENLILEGNNRSVYLYYVYSLLALKEMDFDGYNAYSLLFNERLKEVAVFYRRNNLPGKSTALKGGI